MSTCARYLSLFLASIALGCATGAPMDDGSLYTACESADDCDPRETDACAKVSGSIGKCTIVCESDDDCGDGRCRHDLADVAVCWPD